MSLLVTGKSGTIGKHIVDGNGLNFDLANDEYNFNGLEFKNTDSLIHLGAVVGEKAVNSNEIYSYKVNVRGTRYLAKNFIKKSSGKFLYVSTSHVYSPSLECLSEQSVTEPRSRYASQKLEAEFELGEIFKHEPNRLIIARVFSILDWDVDPFTLGGGIKKIANNDESFVLKNSDDIRDFLTPKLVAQTLCIILSAESHVDKINICTGVGLSVRNAATRMLNEYGKILPKNQVKPGSSDNPIVIGDANRLKEIYGLQLIWNPSKFQ